MCFRYLAVLDGHRVPRWVHGRPIRGYPAADVFGLVRIARHRCVGNRWDGAWIGTGFVPGLPRRAPGVGDLLGLGGGIAGFNGFTFIARNLDNVLIGHAWGDAALGLYDRAYKFLLFSSPASAFFAGARIMLPTLVEATERC